jgi:hypothetical protein
MDNTLVTLTRLSNDARKYAGIGIMPDDVADLDAARAKKQKADEFWKAVRDRKMGRPTIIDDDKLVSDLLYVIFQLPERT